MSKRDMKLKKRKKKDWNKSVFKLILITVTLMKNLKKRRKKKKRIKKKKEKRKMVRKVNKKSKRKKEILMYLMKKDGLMNGEKIKLNQKSHLKSSTMLMKIGRKMPNDE